MKVLFLIARTSLAMSPKAMEAAHVVRFLHLLAHP